MSSAVEKNFATAVGAESGPGPPRVLYRAAAVIDGRGRCGTALLVEFRSAPRVLAIGSDQEVARHPAAARAQTLCLPDSVILPGLVNAHTHLDLTHIGPRPHLPDRGFVPWIQMIRAGRCLDEASVAASVASGAELCLAGGTVAVGDIAGAVPGDTELVPWRSLRQSGLLGISYQELFGIGNRRQAGQERLNTLAGHLARQPAGCDQARFGVQPHAPYTVDLDLYLAAARMAADAALPIATHLAESPEEREFVASGGGPVRDLLDGVGIWDESALRHIGVGKHPVQHLEPALSAARFVVAHVNDADDAAIKILSRTRATVVYCPRASEYFGAAMHFGPHRYREMVQAGVNVALGTDSLVNLPPAAADPARGGMSILDEMRLLSRRDGTEAMLLLQMATIHGGRALRLPEEWFEFEPGGELAGAVAVAVGPERALLGSTWNAQAALQAVLTSGGLPSLLFMRNHSRQTRIHGPRGMPASRLHHSP